jgi:hypothetical protein
MPKAFLGKEDCFFHYIENQRDIITENKKGMHL